MSPEVLLQNGCRKRTDGELVKPGSLGNSRCDGYGGETEWLWGRRVSSSMA